MPTTGLVDTDIAATVRPSVHFRTIGPIGLAQISGGGSTTVSRRGRHITAGGDAVQLRFVDSGRCTARQDGREAHLETGDFTLLDAARPFSVHYPQPFTARIYQFPRTTLGIADRDMARTTAAPLRADHALSAFLLPFLTRLSTDGPTLHPQTRDQLARNVTAILATLITDHLQDAPLQDAARRTLVLRVKRYIMDNLAIPELSPQLIAVHHHISVRYLHKLFASESTTLSRWILRARLERCRRDLAVTSGVAAVAHRWGFTSAARFSRVFRDAYGVSPREFQATVR